MVAMSRCALLTLLLAIASVVQAQDAVRMSLASADAAEARRTAASTIGYYNLKIGPTAWRFGAGLGLQYNSNVELNEESPEGDVILTPEINAQMLWPVTDKNSLTLGLGVGYSAYIIHPELSRFYITPGSELSFDIYSGDFWINLHDRFSISENSYQDPTVTGNGDYSQLQNALGVAATWDLNKVLVRGGYDHVNYQTISGGAGQPNGQSELMSASAGYAFQPGMLAGIELGGGLLNYTGTNVTFTSAKQWNAGVFLDTPVSEYLHFRGSVGYTEYIPDTSGTTNSTSDFTGLYGEIDLQHRVNRFLDYTLSAGHNITFAFYGGAVELTYARLLANWKIMQKTSIGTTLEYDHGTQGIFSPETFNRYGASISLSRTITAKSTGSLGYQFYWRTSNLAGRDYSDNIVSLNYRYSF